MSLGAVRKRLRKNNIKELVGDKCESIMLQMQKTILSSSLHIARMFKLSAYISVGILNTYFNRYLILYVIEILFTYLKGAVSRNSVKLGNHKMPVKLRET